MLEIRKTKWIKSGVSDCIFRIQEDVDYIQKKHNKQKKEEMVLKNEKASKMGFYYAENSQIIIYHLKHGYMKDPPLLFA